MIFVDTSFWVAHANRHDDRHHVARTLMKEHESAGMVSTNHVRGETWTFLRRRVGHRDATAFLDQVLDSPRLEVIHVTDDVEAEALVWLRRHDERPYSFVDAASFAVMRKLGVGEAFAFDGDFSAAGFVELRPA